MQHRLAKASLLALFLLILTVFPSLADETTQDDSDDTVESTVALDTDEYCVVNIPDLIIVSPTAEVERIPLGLSIEELYLKTTSYFKISIEQDDLSDDIISKLTKLSDYNDHSKYDGLHTGLFKNIDFSSVKLTNESLLVFTNNDDKSKSTFRFGRIVSLIDDNIYACTLKDNSHEFYVHLQYNKDFSKLTP
jgi:hypothetical protein